MRRTTVGIDVRSVRLIVDHIGLGSQCIKYTLCDHPGTAVCTVQTDSFILIGTGGQRDQITDVTVSSHRIIHGASDLISDSKRDLTGKTIDISLNLQNGLFIHFFTVAVDQLDSIIIVGIVAGRNHDTAIKILCSCHIGNGRCRCYMKQISLCSGSCQTGNQSILKHIGRQACVFSDDDLTCLAFLFISSIIPAQETADLISVLCS